MKYEIQIGYEIYDCMTCPFRKELRYFEHTRFNDTQLTGVTSIERVESECSLSGERLENSIKAMTGKCLLRRARDE